jgi:hypothetical protein
MTTEQPVLVVLLDGDTAGGDTASVDTQPESALFQAALTSTLLWMRAGGEGERDSEESKRLLAALAEAEGLTACRRVMGAFFRLEWERQNLPRQ